MKPCAEPGRGGVPPWKCDFHLHTAEDPFDAVDHTAVELVERAAALGYDAIAITLHQASPSLAAAQARAADLGLLLIPGIEWSVGDRHLLGLGLPEPVSEPVDQIDAVRELRREWGERMLVIAPHPFYVVAHSMNGLFHQWVDCFDAVKITRLQTRWVSRNGPALRAARHYRLPVVANSDTHALRHFGRHYTLVHGEDTLTQESLFHAIRAGKTEPVCPPLSLVEFARELFEIFFVHAVRKRLRRHSRRVQPGQTTGGI